ncbi:MAG: ATP-binding cassette domain-containing protein [Planctomycetaceae bacterium]
MASLTTEIPAGITAVLGFSGAGKTSLLNLLVGFERPTSGTCDLFLTGSDVASADFSVPLAWVPQDGGLWGHLSVRQHLETVAGGAGRKKEGGNPNSSDKLMEAFDLLHRRQSFPGGLSRGEQSRLSVCRALASRAEMLVMDEPLSHLDAARRPGYWQAMMQAIQHSGTSLVFSTHESETVLKYAETVICLDAGQLAFQGKTLDLYNRPASRQLAEFLGPVNWFDDDDQRQWLGKSFGSHPAVRPERLVIVTDDQSPCEIQHSQFCGSLTETTMQHVATGARRTFLHRSAVTQFLPGQRAALQVGT